jgi:DNA polymerase-3 subunit gamma/tau
MRAAVPGHDRAPEGGPIVVPDDEPSVDDPTIEESGLVGPSVVAQLLGGRVIEERDE